jgi:C-terminal processing protease CtpA/Prc
MHPRQPHVGGRVVFMTDARAISYAESVMGYVADRKLGIIVGSTTAGTNGNVAVATLPGGYSMSFTGMRVTRHDGTSPFHLIGVRPDVPVAPTIAGLRAGKDEILERAVAIVGR